MLKFKLKTNIALLGISCGAHNSTPKKTLPSLHKRIFLDYLLLLVTTQLKSLEKGKVRQWVNLKVRAGSNLLKSNDENTFGLCLQNCSHFSSNLNQHHHNNKENCSLVFLGHSI